jgi:ornithine carbamoyltransferase
METLSFLRPADLDDSEILDLLELTDRIRDRKPRNLLQGKTLGMIFESKSLRTRVSFAVAMIQLGGSALTLSAPDDLYPFSNEEEGDDLFEGHQVEDIRDAARTLSKYLDAVGIRFSKRGESWEKDRQDLELLTFAKNSEIPVINLQSKVHHPCQALADIYTMRQKVRTLKGRRLSIAWVQSPSSQSPGIPHSLLALACRMGMKVTLAHPQGFELDEEIQAQARRDAASSGGSLQTVHDLDKGIQDSDFLYARSWASLTHYGDPDREALLKRSLGAWNLSMAHYQKAGQPWFLQPLPVRRGVSVATEVLEGERSLVYPQAENKLHVQKALLVHLLSRSRS